MFKRKNDLPETTRIKVVELLNARMADCKDLQTQTVSAASLPPLSPDRGAPSAL
jgi:hypothetical protein